MNGDCYLWDGHKVIHIPGWLGIDRAIALKVTRMPCVDTSEKSEPLRYGIFTGMGWESRELENFPTAFRTHLLLLGVS